MFPNLKSDSVVRFKIAGLPTDKQYNALPFGRQIEHRNAIAAFKARAKSVYVSMKHRTFASALRDARSLYNATEYYCTTHDSANYRDDSFEFWFVSASPAVRDDRNDFDQQYTLADCGRHGDGDGPYHDEE